MIKHKYTPYLAAYVAAVLLLATLPLIAALVL